MIIKPPKPGLGFGIRDLGFWDLGFGLALAWVWQKVSVRVELRVGQLNYLCLESSEVKLYIAMKICNV